MCLRWDFPLHSEFPLLFHLPFHSTGGGDGSGWVGEIVDVYLCWMQVFVANPKKPPQIEAILRRNKEKLLVFLKGFHNDKDDEQFTVSSFCWFCRDLSVVFVLSTIFGACDAYVSMERAERTKEYMDGGPRAPSSFLHSISLPGFCSLPLVVCADPFFFFL